MHRCYKHILSIIFSAAILVAVFLVGAAAYDYPAMPDNWQNLQVTVGSVTMPLRRYPDGSTFSGSKTYMTVEEASEYGIYTNSDIWLRSSQCLGFARYTYLALFYKYPQNAYFDNTLGYSTVSNSYYTNMIKQVLGTDTLAAGYDAATLKTLITACQPGAIIRISGHSMIIMGIYDDGLIIYDNNFAGANEVDVRMYTWQTFVNKLGYRGIEALHMPTYYPGYSYSYVSTDYPIDSSTAGRYQVYNCSSVNIRAYPDGYSALKGTYTSGTLVDVLGSYNDWYAVSYNGATCWVYSSYLKAYTGNVTITFDAAGGSCDYTTKDYVPGQQFGTLPSASKSNRVFLGWYSGSTQYTTGSTVPDTPVTLTAMWGIGSFTDVAESSWYASYVETGLSAGLISSDSLFNPERQTKRCEFVTVLAREYTRETGKAIPTTFTNPFTDVPNNSYYAASVAWAYSAGIVKGVSDTEFAPDASITREQIATLIYRYAQYVGAAGTYTGSNLIGNFVDGNQVSDYAIPAMNWAISTGLMNGVGNGYLSPLTSAKRCEMITLIVRLMNYIG